MDKNPKHHRNLESPSQMNMAETSSSLSSEETQSVVSDSELRVEEKPKRPFPIVGIGASAGGLAEFEAFFSAISVVTNINMAFVLVQHLSPDYKSLLSELVRRYTKMQVFEVEDGMIVQPNCVYIIPPNRDMALLNGALQLLEQESPRGQRLSIDFFFSSLAKDQRENAIGIVLSGSGSDGTLGVRAIKNEGGMVMAQTPESAQFNNMPRSAIATGLIDYILPPAEMPNKLIAYVSHALGKMSQSVTSSIPIDADALKKIHILLRAKSGHDFSLYKTNTVARRVERRMAVQQIAHIDDYVRYLNQTPTEIEDLFKDLLIGVTHFFRDTDAFAEFQELVIPEIFSKKTAEDMIRVWVPGCSTGEEAYSIAILFQEYKDASKQNVKIQVFATDIDTKAVEIARSGIYPLSIATDVSPERLGRYFLKAPVDDTYRIHKNIRDMLIFCEQNVIRDPSFSKLDLISCRNLLIYLGGELQKRLIPLFHYALNPGGILFLGTSETTGDFTDLFDTLSRKSKLYQRKEAVLGGRNIRRILPQMTTTERGLQPATKKTLAENTLSPREITEQALLLHYAPTGVLIDKNGEILYLHGRTGLYLEPSPGEPGSNILKMAREGLLRDLTTALHKAKLHKEAVVHKGVQVKTNGDFTTIDLNVRPVGANSDAVDLFLITFKETSDEEVKLSDPTITDNAAHNTDANARVTALMQELRAKEEYLQATIEELETSNEELKSSNEEMQSINEEMQSVNEELETSKEEMQSVNEELATVNSELQVKVADLSQANNDMSNLLAGTGIGTIFVDHHLRIKRFTPIITQVINLIPSDVGRPVGHIVSNLMGYHQLAQDVQGVLDDLLPREFEVQTLAGVWYLLRIRPYRTLENVIEGAVITFVEITDLKKALESLKASEAQNRLAIVVRDSQDAYIVQDLAGKVLAWNPSAEKLYGWTEAEALQMNICQLIPESQQKEALAMLRKMSQAELLEPYQAQRLTKTGQHLEVRIAATTLVNHIGNIYAIATTERLAKGHDHA